MKPETTSPFSHYLALSGTLDKLTNANAMVYTLYECLERSELTAAYYTSTVLGVFEHFETLLDELKELVEALREKEA